MAFTNFTPNPHLPLPQLTGEQAGPSDVTWHLCVYSSLEDTSTLTYHMDPDREPPFGATFMALSRP